MSLFRRDSFFDRPSVFDTDPWFTSHHHHQHCCSNNFQTIPVVNRVRTFSSSRSRNDDSDFRRMDDDFEETVRRARERMEANMREFDERVSQSRARMNELSSNFAKNTQSSFNNNSSSSSSYNRNSRSSYNNSSSSNRRSQRHSSFDSSLRNNGGNMLAVNQTGGCDSDFSLNMTLPRNINPSNINVSVEGGNIVVKAEDKVDEPNHKSSASFYHSATLPSNIDVNAMKAFYDNGQLNVSAPAVKRCNNQVSNSGGQSIKINHY